MDSAPDAERSSPISDSRPEEEQPPLSKRQKKTVRKKPACQTCRRRKIRCDTGDPACGFCQTNDLACVYASRDDSNVGQQELSKVFERLETLSQAVENIQHLLTSRNDPTKPGPEPGPQFQAQAQPPEPEQRGHDFQRIPDRDGEWHQDYLQIPACRCSADAVLTWPIFGGRFQENSLITTLFQCYSHGEVENQSTSGESGILQDGIPMKFTPDEQIPALVDQFIQNVHTKNPILDLESLIRSGRHAAEFGLQWDAQSCLVLIACALGCVSQAFTSSTQGNAYQPAGSTSSSSLASGLRGGEAFFMMARKRIGLLHYSVIGAECHFFAGVYLMYTFRPLSAWNHFYQASTFYRLRLRLIEGLDRSIYDSSATTSQRSEQSLYWSCFKSEVEIRVELPLPQSAIAEFEYPALFPTPPVLSDEYPKQHQNQASMQASDWDWDRSESHTPMSTTPAPPNRGVLNHIRKLFDEEQSWYYYLTEVALRRIGNRVLNSFYRSDSSAWSNIRPSIPMALEFESQINAWFANLPPAMKYYGNQNHSSPNEQGYPEGTTSANTGTNTRDSITLELSWALGNRFLEIRLWLYQPFLYYAVHHHHHLSNMHTEESAIIQNLVESGIDCTLKILQARCLRHRHHGIWFDLRALVTASLIVIALTRSGRHLDLSGGLKTHLAPTLETLEYWGDEAPDLEKARVVLENLLRDSEDGAD